MAHRSPGSFSTIEESIQVLMSLRVFCLLFFSSPRFLSFTDSFPSAQLIHPQYTFVFISSSVSMATRKCHRCSSRFLLPVHRIPKPNRTLHTCTAAHKSCNGSSAELWEVPGQLVSKEGELLRGLRSPFEGGIRGIRRVIVRRIVKGFNA